MMWPFNRKKQLESRSAMSGFTAELIGAREAYISGQRGLAELTGTVQAAVSLWENGFSIADVEGAPLLNRRSMALVGRSLALRGEAVFLMHDDLLVPCSDWDVKTKYGQPTAYRLSYSEAMGGKSTTALAGEVLHFRHGADVVTPYYGTAPLKRASLSANMLHSIEAALHEVYENAPLGSMVVPFPETSEEDISNLARGFRGNRGKVMIRESVAVAAAGGLQPQQDWRPQSVSPDLERTMSLESLEKAQESILMTFGCLPSMTSKTATGPLIREAQRHLAQWTLQPLAELIAEEASEKMGTAVRIDTMRPLQAYDAGGRARAAMGLIKALAEAKEAGIDPGLALKAVDLEQN